MIKLSSGLSAQKKKDRLFYVSICAIPLLQFLIFYVYVNINSVVMAFQEYVVDHDTNRGTFVWAQFKNFESLFFSFANEGILSTALKNTMISFVVTIVAGVGLSMIFSYYIAKKKPLYGLFKFVLFVPSMISSVVTVLIFRYFSETVLLSVINSIGHKNMTGLLYGTTDVAFSTVLFFNVWTGFGTMMLMFSGAMSDINDSIIEAAMLDGANACQEFFLIYIPMTYSTMVTFIVVNIAGMFSNQMSLYSFFGAQAETDLWTIGYWLFKNLSQGTLSMPEYPELAAAGVVLTVVATPITLLVKRLLEKIGPSED